MTPDLPLDASERIRGRLLLWVTLNHFLPAELLRELFASLVDELGHGKLSVSDILEEELTQGASAFRTWTIRPRLGHDGIVPYLQQLAQVLLWAGDEEAFWTPDEPDPHLHAWTQDIRHAQALAARSLTDALGKVEDWPAGLKPLVNAMLRLQKPTDRDPSAIASDLTQVIEPPLAGVALKHLGDLCAERDDWDAAMGFYAAAQSAAKTDDPAWADFEANFAAICLQSMAAASWALVSPDNFVIMLEETLPTATLTSQPLLLANAKQDELVARLSDRRGFDFPGDDRPAVRAAPLLVHSQDAARGWNAWTQGKFTAAYRGFWATLRRQIALGAVDAARTTKIAFARCIVEGLDAELAQHHRPDVFLDAVRMMLESGQAGPAADARWTERLVKTYVTREALHAVIEHVQPARGEGVERLLVVIALFERWLVLLPPEADAPANAMLAFLAFTGERQAYSRNSGHDLAGRSHKALRRVARSRPELRRRVARDVAGAVEAHLGDADALAISDALETLGEYYDVISPDRLRTTLNVILDLLDRLGPKASDWTIIRPALDLLASEAAKVATQGSPDLRSRLTTTTVRFALEEGTEHTRLLILLRDLDPDLVAEVDPQRLQDVIGDLRRRASGTNSNAAADCVYALLAAPKLVGLAGVEDALSGLNAILKTAADPRTSISFAGAHRPVVMLGERAGLIARDLAISDAAFAAMVSPILEQLLSVWELAPKSPLIFAPFRIPRATAPNSALVHNFAFGALALAGWLDRLADMQAALDAAAASPLLADGIASGRAARVTAGDLDRVDDETLGREPREAFYGALGARVVKLRALSPADRRDRILLLLTRCFDLGPQGVDAGLFAAALDADLAGKIPDSDAVADYRQRLGHDSALRLSLAPLVHELFVPTSAGASDEEI